MTDNNIVEFYNDIFETINENNCNEFIIQVKLQSQEEVIGLVFNSSEEDGMIWIINPLKVNTMMHPDGKLFFYFSEWFYTDETIYCVQINLCDIVASFPVGMGTALYYYEYNEKMFSTKDKKENTVAPEQKHIKSKIPTKFTNPKLEEKVSKAMKEGRMHYFANSNLVKN